MKRGTAMDAAREITAENARPGDLDGLDADGWPIGWTPDATGEESSDADRKTQE